MTTKKKKADNVTEELCKKHLACKLSNDELLEVGRELGRRENDKLALDDEKKKANAEFSSREKSIKADIGVLIHKINTGEEHRDVECKNVINWSDRSRQVTRLDTNEVVRTDTVSEADCQTRLDLKEKEMKEAKNGPYGIWNGEKFLSDDKNERYEFSSVSGAGDTLAMMRKEGVTLTVEPLSKADLTEKPSEEKKGKDKK